MIWFITICAVVITILIYLCKSWILHGVFGKIEEDVMRHADIYLMIVAASIPFIALYNGGAAIFRTMGNSEVSMRVSMIMNVINVTGSADLWFSPGDRRRGNSDSHIQNDSGDFDCNALNASGSGGIHGAFAFLSFRLEDD